MPAPRRNGLWPNRLVRGKAPSLGLGKQLQFGFWIGKLFLGVSDISHTIVILQANNWELQLN